MGLAFYRSAAAVIPLTLIAHVNAQTEVAKLIASDGALGDSFGYSVAIEGDTAVVGATGADPLGGNSGAVYLFHRDGDAWFETSRLIPSGGDGGDGFGCSVSICGSAAVFGAFGDDDLGQWVGAAYVFEKAGNTWTEASKLTASTWEPYDRFGEEVCIDGQTVVVGAPSAASVPGAVYVFDRIGGAWQQTAKLEPAGGAAYDRFGRSVWIHGDTVLVGSTGDDNYGEDSGAAYVFERSNGIWLQVAELSASDGSPQSYFGASVSLDGDVAVIGAPYDDAAGGNAGAAYVYERSEGVWAEVLKFTAPAPDSQDLTGRSVRVSGNVIMVASLADGDLGEDAGVVYVLQRRDGEWQRVSEVTASDGGAGDLFGRLGLSGDFALIGAPGEDDRDKDAGAAYVVDLSDLASCAADFNGDGFTDTRDVIAFLNAWTVGDGAADFDGNGLLDTRDVIAFLNAWGTGC